MVFLIKIVRLINNCKIWHGLTMQVATERIASYYIL